jgi:hypothetical protein
MKYKVIHRFSHKGLRYKAGDVIELSADEVKSFAPGYVEKVSKAGTVVKKTKGIVTKKTK